MKFPLGSIIGNFALGLLLNSLLVAVLAYPISWLWNGCVSSWLHLPEMEICDSFGVLLLLVLVSTVIRGVKLSTGMSTSSSAPPITVVR